jgi:hypothetical protein
MVLVVAVLAVVVVLAVVGGEKPTRLEEMLAVTQRGRRRCWGLPLKSFEKRLKG